MQFLLIVFVVISQIADFQAGEKNAELENKTEKSAFKIVENFLSLDENISSNHGKENKALNWVSKWLSSFKNMTTEDQRNYITNNVKTLTNKLKSIIDIVPLSAQMVFLEYVKSICKKGLPQPFNFIASLTINRFIKYIIIRNEKLKHKTKANTVKQRYFSIIEKILLDEKMQEMIKESTEKMVKSYLIALNSIVDVYINDCERNSEESTDIAKYTALLKVEETQNVGKIINIKDGDSTFLENIQNSSFISWCHDAWFKLKNYLS